MSLFNIIPPSPSSPIGGHSGLAGLFFREPIHHGPRDGQAQCCLQYCSRSLAFISNLKCIVELKRDAGIAKVIKKKLDRKAGGGPVFFCTIASSSWIMNSSRLVALCLVIALAFVSAEDADPAGDSAAAGGCTFENILP